MTLIELFTSTESIEKTRKSLFVGGVALPLFAGVNFLTEELTIFGLTVQVSHDRLVQIGRLAVTFLLIILFLRAIPVFLSWLHKQLEIYNTKWETTVRANLPDYGHAHGLNEFGEDNSFDNLEEYEVDFYKNIERRKKISLYIGVTFNFTGELVASFANYIIPVFLGFVAVVEPYYLSNILNHIEYSHKILLIDQIEWKGHDFHDPNISISWPKTH